MRNKFTEFTTTERNGDKVVTAQPANGVDEPVRFDGSIAESGSSEELEANWEGIIASLAQQHLGGQLTIDDGRGVMDREEAVQALVESDAERVKNQHAAHAVIEYLASEDILRLEDDQVVLLMSSENLQDENAYAMLNNWAATLDACVERIDAAVDRVERNQETLEKHVENLEDTTSIEQDYAQKKEEIEQEIKAMLGGRSPSELEGDERERFKRMRERYHRYESLEESVSGGPKGPEMEGPQMLAELVEELESVKFALQDHSTKFRTLAVSKNLQDSDAREMVRNFTEVAAEIGGATDPKDKMEEISDEEFMDQISEVSERTEETELAAEESTTITER
ncbi:hypothetical protein [Haloparvum sp. PAK95]|uniref:hypothetical protein n=1 Tax=Haloparvum sp. PAK95 TaxID=3418962 RepID=UPI003D2ECAA7